MQKCGCFFALLRAGLWREADANLNLNADLNIPKVLLLQWIGDVQLIEQRNKEMNAFIASLIADMLAMVVNVTREADFLEKLKEEKV